VPDPRCDLAGSITDMPDSGQDAAPTVRVYLVDDHEVVRRGLRELLESAPGIEVVGESGSAAQAIRRIPAIRPDVAVIDMLEKIHRENVDLKVYLERVKKREVKMMGFGHRIYKNYDPRARILQKQAENVLKLLNVNDPLLDIARKLEEAALSDSYFKDRNLYPNVDFYSGIILRAIGIPVNMFTVMFAIGRMPGWIANWKEVNDRPEVGINRPRQVYTGPAIRDYVPISRRG